MNAVLQVETALAAASAENAARRLAKQVVRESFEFEKLHEYRDATGQPVYFRWRVRKDSGEKVIRPMHYNGTAYVAGEPAAPATGKLLYRLPELLAADPAAPVFIVEGEWCADHLHALPSRR